jgi:hypothetical protein
MSSSGLEWLREPLVRPIRSDVPSWYLKAVLQGGMSHLPDPQRWNRLFQRHVTKGLELTREPSGTREATAVTTNSGG